MTFDRYHLAAKLSEAVNEVRRAEVTTRPELRRTRWLWLKNWSNLSAKQQGELHQLMRPSAQLATARALRWRQDFQAFYDQHPSYAPEHPSTCAAGAPARNAPACSPSRTSSPSWRTIGTPVVAWPANHLNNGLLEGINSLVQAAKPEPEATATKPE